MTFRDVCDGVEFRVKVVPGARRDRVVGVLGDAVKLAVTAAPEKGKANQAVIELLAEALGTRRKAVKIVAGRTSSRKTVVVEGIDAKDCRRRLLGS